eukprot:scaffold9231_cov130-Skeletonema_menzelii.AAC.3
MYALGRFYLAMRDVEGAPENAEIQVLPNVGRNDHTFAYYITSILPHLPTADVCNALTAVILVNACKC